VPAAQLARLEDANDHALKKLKEELKQKLADVRGRGSQLYRDWFFHNPISFLRECDGDRCEFWRFRYPRRREIAMEVLCEQARLRYPPPGAAGEAASRAARLRWTAEPPPMALAFPARHRVLVSTCRIWQAAHHLELRLWAAVRDAIELRSVASHRCTRGGVVTCRDVVAGTRSSSTCAS
jgi:hypothetical protein